MAGQISRRDALRAVAVTGAGAIVTTGAAIGPADQVIALTHVTVIDASGPPRENVTVLVRGRRIAAVGPAVPIPDGARVIDLTGRYVIPGLCDMHVHSFLVEGISPALYLANGVTTVREMYGRPEFHEWRRRIGRGDLLGPRWVIGSKILDGPSPIGTDPAIAVTVETEEQARAAVRQAVREGADFIKVYSNLRPGPYRAIAREARELGVPYAGHLPDRVPIAEAAAAGQRGIEHLNAVWYSTSTRERQIRAAIEAQKIPPGDHPGRLRAGYELEWMAARSQSRRLTAMAFERLAQARTRVAPTLTVYRVLDRPHTVGPDPRRMKYVPARIAGFWARALRDMLRGGRTQKEAARWSRLLDLRLELVRAMDEAGVPIMTGTDGGDVPYVVPGFGLHDELAGLVWAGFSPSRALRAATLEPARYLGREHDLGTVERGKLADLVILDADPLREIANTTRVHAVLADGTWISPSHRTRLLAEAAKAAEGH
ncbi:hypothetical protein DP939_00395 [Spongiactinospora rosea]|uniref:Amidohydrolase-related domain-containing protein n=1 Tax=Spongiactinospora rosea TaxID=2248750 RepID=A0A366M5B5_9ACTN|nr:amidohydrolase family protein [Spongiactinospora rosea]RBQ21227.1 hypothetical protein DP939_00395 [Spongiactinospora rosea]